jgi:hypothetical protein
MNTIQWYAMALAAAVAFSSVFYILRVLIEFLRIYATFHFLKHIYYPQVHKYVRGSSTTSRFDALLIIAFMAGNAICLILDGIPDRNELLHRTGLLSTVNFVPLALGSHINLIVSYCRLGLEAYNRIYRWIGWVVVIEGLSHMILTIAS